MDRAPGRDGRLLSRPSLPEPGSLPPHPPGLHRIAADGLLLVPDAPGPHDLLVFFHGAGGSASRSLGLVQEAATRHGLLTLLPSSIGSTWDLVRQQSGPDVVRLDGALGQVRGEYAVRRTGFAGFSDGASYALSLGLANGDLVDGVLAFSPGFLAPPARVGRPRAWVTHGTEDAVLPVEICGRRVVARLREQGYPVTYTEFEGGHVVPGDLLDASLGQWLGGPPAPPAPPLPTPSPPTR